MSPNGVDQAGAEVVVQRRAAEQQAVEDGPKQELVDQADLGVGAQVAPGDAALDHRRELGEAGLG